MEIQIMLENVWLITCSLERQSSPGWLASARPHTWSLKWELHYVASWPQKGICVLCIPYTFQRYDQARHQEYTPQTFLGYHPDIQTPPKHFQSISRNEDDQRKSSWDTVCQWLILFKSLLHRRNAQNSLYLFIFHDLFWVSVLGRENAEETWKVYRRI